MIYLTLILSLLLILIWIYLAYKKYGMLIKMKQTRIQIAHDLHDEIGAALSSISFYSEACKLNLQQQNTDKTMEMLDKIGITSRESISAMNDIIWVIHPKNDKLETLFHRIAEFGRAIFINNQTQFYFYTDPAIARMVLPIEYRKNMFLICKEALHNASKYAEANHVELLIKKEHSQIKVIIKDDGIGFNKDRSEGGNGMLSMKVRTESLHGKFMIDSKEGVGTAISLSIPYPQNW